jgi:hypothetical protein
MEVRRKNAQAMAELLVSAREYALGGSVSSVVEMLETAVEMYGGERAPLPPPSKGRRGVKPPLSVPQVEWTGLWGWLWYDEYDDPTAADSEAEALREWWEARNA